MEPMSEAELLELVAIYGNTCMTALSLFVTFTFGYMTVSYLIGEKLTTPQVIGLTLLYLLAAIAIALVGFANLSAMGALQQELANSEVYQRTYLLDAEIYLALWPLVCIGGIAVSVYLMYNVRNS